MNIKNELKIFLRFLKEKNIYDEYKFLFKEINDKKCDICDVFDANLSWNYTKEGFKFWYFMQLDFISVLVTYAPNNLGYISYYGRLITGYYHEHYMNDNIWKCHKDYYKKCLEKFGNLRYK